MRIAGTNLLRAGLLVFGLGVGVNYLGGDSFRMPALALQLVGVGILVANAAKSRRDVTREPDDEPPS